MDNEKQVDDIPLPIKILGIPIDKAIALLQTVGVPLGFMIFVCYLAWSYFPPVAAAHIELLQRTGATLEKMEVTLKDYNKTIEEFSRLGKETSAFMQSATETHKIQTQTLSEIKSVLVKDKNGNL